MTTKGDRSRVTDHDEYSRTIERIHRNEARKKRLQKRVLRQHRLELDYAKEEFDYDEDC